MLGDNMVGALEWVGCATPACHGGLVVGGEAQLVSVDVMAPEGNWRGWMAWFLLVMGYWVGGWVGRPSWSPWTTGWVPEHGDEWLGGRVPLAAVQKPDSSSRCHWNTDVGARPLAVLRCA